MLNTSTKLTATIGVSLASLVWLSGCSVAGPVATDYPFAAYSASIVCQPDFVSGQRTDSLGRIVFAAVDTFGNELPETEVTVSRAGVESEYVADDHGRLVVQDLPSGPYRIVAHLPGFQKAAVETVQVQRGCVTALIVPLQVIDLVD